MEAKQASTKTETCCDVEGLCRLADGVVAWLYNDLIGARPPYRAFLERVIERQADVVAPCEDQPAFAACVNPPPADQRVYQTFCGT